MNISKDYNLLLSVLDNDYVIYQPSNLPFYDLQPDYYAPFGFFLVEFANIGIMRTIERMEKDFPERIKASEIAKKIPIVEEKLLKYVKKEIVEIILYDYIQQIKKQDRKNRLIYYPAGSVFFEDYYFTGTYFDYVKFRAYCQLAQEILEGKYTCLTSFVDRDIKDSINFNYYQRNFDIFQVYSVRQIPILLEIDRSNLKKCPLKIVNCANCGRYFFTDSLKNKYCDNISPQDENKTCKKYMDSFRAIQYLRSNKPSYMYSAVYTKLQKYTRRHPEDMDGLKKFEDFQVNSKQWKDKLKDGTVTENEYLEWLNSI